MPGLPRPGPGGPDGFSDGFGDCVGCLVLRGESWEGWSLGHVHRAPVGAHELRGLWPALWPGVYEPFLSCPSCFRGISVQSASFLTDPQPLPVTNLEADYFGFAFRMDPESNHFSPVLPPPGSAPSPFAGLVPVSSCAPYRSLQKAPKKADSGPTSPLPTALQGSHLPLSKSPPLRPQGPA